MSSKTASDRFSILKNGIDSRLEIIRDNDTGCYNITKTAKMIAKLLELEANNQDDEAYGNPYASKKLEKPSKWFANDETNKLINECKRQTKLDDAEIRYELKKGINPDFAGTYVHPKLYDHFLIWLDPIYGMRVSDILNQIHQDTNRKLLQEKDNAIQQLKDAIQKQGEEAKAYAEAAAARDEAQSARIEELLLRGDITITKLTETHTELIETRGELSEARVDIRDGNNQIERLTDKVEECREVIVDRMDEHTINPKSITKRQYFTCMQHPEYCNVLYVVRGQMTNIKRQVNAHKTWDTLIDPVEDPNSIKMFNRFNERVKSIERSWKAEIRSQYKNKEFDSEVYSDKIHYMHKYPLIKVTGNNIEFDNDRITLEEVLKLMRDTTFDRFNLSVP